MEKAPMNAIVIPIRPIPLLGISDEIAVIRLARALATEGLTLRNVRGGLIIDNMPEIPLKTSEKR
jgi:hypothetical protein